MCALCAVTAAVWGLTGRVKRRERVRKAQQGWRTAQLHFQALVQRGVVAALHQRLGHGGVPGDHAEVQPLSDPSAHSQQLHAPQQGHV